MSDISSRPNILLIMTDQHNKHVLGSYGDNCVRTPNLDCLASEGMRFTDAYCPSPLCVPSRMSFMTSQTPSTNRYPVAGRSLFRILTEGADEQWSQETVSELVDTKHGILPSRMIRSGAWILWAYADEQNPPPALFNLDTDPEELNDLGQSSAYEPVRERLLRCLHHCWNPRDAAMESARQIEYWHVLARWGQVVNPESFDALIYPPAEYEADVELL